MCGVVSIEEVYLGPLAWATTCGNDNTWNYNGRYCVVEPVVRCNVLTARNPRQIDRCQAQIRAAKLFDKISERMLLKVKVHRLPRFRKKWSSSATASPFSWSKPTSAGVAAQE